jgi:hypothetical protein
VKELLLVVAFYAAYTFARNYVANAQVGATHAYHNALRVIALEKRLGPGTTSLFVEQRIQHAFLGPHWNWFIRFWNVYYGSFHFIVTIGVFIWLFIRAPERFTRWRNVLGITTALAIVGFMLFPLMPPRLLDSGPPYGARQYVTLDAQHRVIAVGPDVDGNNAGKEFGFEDTLATRGGFWSFGNGVMQDISNQYAAMPSLHTAWAFWSLLVLWPLVRHRSLRVLLALYPIATVFCIIVTANHYLLDAAGGVLILGIGLWAGTRLDERNRRRQAASDTAEVTAA